jgi:hypothetical protein
MTSVHFGWLVGCVFFWRLKTKNEETQEESELVDTRH